MVVPNSVLEEKEEHWMKSLWDEIRGANASREGKGKAPIAKIDLKKEQMNLDIASKYQAARPTTFRSSKPLYSRNFHILWETTKVEMI